MIWAYDDLWQKAKLYAARAFAENRDGDVFPLWAVLSLEFVARAALARVHPALLADPQSGENLLSAFGFGTVAIPKSVPAKTVFHRCTVIIPEFTEAEYKQCLALVERRNAELHSGELAFANCPTARWLADYFRANEILVSFQDKRLDELFGEEEAKAAEVMIAASQKATLGAVRARIALASTTFLELPEEQRTASTAQGIVRPPRGALVPCPSCGSQALITGEQFRATEPKMGDGGVIYRDIMVLPTALTCHACGLTLRGHDEVHAADLGGQYSVTVEEDPAEFYGLAYVDEDYGND